MANAANLPRLALAASARHGSSLLAASIFVGLLLPGVAHRMHGALGPVVVLMMTVVLLRVDVPAAFAHLRRPGRLAAIVAFNLLVCPLAAALAVRGLGAAGMAPDPGAAAGFVLFATGPALLSSAAFARMAGLDPELALLGTLATTLLSPLTAPPLAHWLSGVDLALSVAALAGRLALAVGVPLLVSAEIRRTMGEARLAPLGPAVDGVMVWLIVLFGLGVVDGLSEQFGRNPGWIARATALAFAAAFGLNLLTTAAFTRLGPRAAATAGLLSGNRNMGLFLAVLPGSADPGLLLFLALVQFPMYLGPFVFRPLYRRVRP